MHNNETPKAMHKRIADSALEAKLFVENFNRTEAFCLISSVGTITPSKRAEYLYDVTINGVTEEVWSSDIVKFATTL